VIRLTVAFAGRGSHPGDSGWGWSVNDRLTLDPPNESVQTIGTDSGFIDAQAVVGVFRVQEPSRLGPLGAEDKDTDRFVGIAHQPSIPQVAVKYGHGLRPFDHLTTLDGVRAAYRL
jgi:hypothetical protein